MYQWKRSADISTDREWDDIDLACSECSRCCFGNSFFREWARLPSDVMDGIIHSERERGHVIFQSLGRFHRRQTTLFVYIVSSIELAGMLATLFWSLKRLSQQKWWVTSDLIGGKQACVTEKKKKEWKSTPHHTTSNIFFATNGNSRKKKSYHGFLYQKSISMGGWVRKGRSRASARAFFFFFFFSHFRFSPRFSLYLMPE